MECLSAFTGIRNDPEHCRLRGLVDQAFQHRMIGAMKPMITEIADRLLDRLVDGI